MREEPTEGASVALVVSFEDGTDAPAAVQRLVADLGGTVDRELQFGALQVTVPETGIDTLCSVEGIDHVQTADSLSLGLEETDGESDEPLDEE